MTIVNAGIWHFSRGCIIYIVNNKCAINTCLFNIGKYVCWNNIRDSQLMSKTYNRYVEFVNKFHDLKKSYSIYINQLIGEYIIVLPGTN